MKRFQHRLGLDKNEHYKYVADDLFDARVFDKNEHQIANDFGRKIRTQDEIDLSKSRKKNNNDLRF